MSGMQLHSQEAGLDGSSGGRAEVSHNGSYLSPRKLDRDSHLPVGDGAGAYGLPAALSHGYSGVDIAHGRAPGRALAPRVIELDDRNRSSGLDIPDDALPCPGLFVVPQPYIAG